MPRADLKIHFAKIKELIDEIDGFVPSTTYESVKFRADLAGLLVVAMAATYETCVKEIMFEFANQRHEGFGGFARRNFQKLNSRIKVSDLENYCKLFDPSIRTRFKVRLSAKKKAILDRVGKNIVTSYEQILSWRHDFAHAGIRQTTIEEAAATHRNGKLVLYVFDDVLNRPQEAPMQLGEPVPLNVFDPI